MSSDHHLYTTLAPWWPLLSAPEDYREEAAWFADRLAAAATGKVQRVLELGSGGGNNASHMKARFAMTLVDTAPAMLEVSRRLNPECEHIAGDMRALRLGQLFDGVFVHDAASYLTTEADVSAVCQTAAAHCRPGGAVVIAPDFVRETFRAGPSSGGHDRPDGAGLRYVEWIWDPEPADTTYQVDYAILVRSADGRVEAMTDRHTCGMLPAEAWRKVMGAAGFDVRQEVDPFQRLVFIGRRKD